MKSQIRVAILLLFLGLWQVANSQCIQPEFTLQANGCLNESIFIENTSSVGDFSYEWDFCSGDFQSSPTANVVLNDVNFFRARSIKMIEDNGNWYGFSISATSNILMRLDFGSNINSTPTLNNLGNVGSVIDLAWSIDIIEEDGLWKLFVANGGGKNILRYNFVNGIESVPVVQVLNTPVVFDVTGPNSLKIVKDGNNYFCFVSAGTSAANSKIVRLNFGTTLDNASPSTSQFTLASANIIRGMSFVKECDNWIGLALSQNTNSLYRIDFGSDLTSTPITSILDTSGLLNTPVNIEVRNENGNYYAFVQNARVEVANAALYKISFGQAISNTSITTEKLSFPELTGGGFAFDIVTNNSSWRAYTFNLGTNNLLRFDFTNNCDASLSVSSEVNPPLINYFNSGQRYITLKKTDNSDNTTYLVKPILVSSNQASDISFTSQNICANNDVNFTSENISGDITDYNWDFGDTNTSMAQDPIHQFAAAGDYEVKLQVTASNGCNNLARQTLTIYNEPVANFDLPSASPICTNQDYLFTNTTSFDAGSNPTWQWEVNGTPTSTTQDLTYEIPTATVQDIKLIASIPGCSSEVTKTINTVEDGPLADFSFVNDCEDKSITFTNTTVGTVTGYSWDFGDGNTSGLTNGANTFDDFGTYDVTLEATNAAGCINTSVQEITIYSKPQPDFSLDLPPFSCNGSPSQFNDLTPNPADSNLDSWAWSFGDTQSGISAVRNPQYIYEDAGQYNVNLDVTTNFGCTASVQKMVTIYQTPNVNFSFNAACVNQGTSFVPQSASGIDSWQWKIGTSTYNQQNPTHVFSSPATYNAQLTANGSNGCIGVASQMVNVPVPSVVDFSFENNCTNQDTQFTDLTSTGSDPVSSRLWQFGSLGSASGANPSFSFPTAGSYPTKLTVINQSGCSYSTTKIVNITQSPIATFTATPQTGTAPLTVQLNNTSPSSISQLWTANDPTNATSTAKTASFTFDKLGEYVVDLTIEDESGCTSVSSKIISVIIPTLDIELTQLSLMPSATGESNILLSLTNKSNFPVNNIKAIIDISGEALISETITATIQPNEVYSQILSTGIIGSRNGTSYLCVELVVDGDADIRNNKKCLNNDAATVVMAPYPNPGSENLNLEWISTAATSAEIHIFDPTGRKVYEDMFFDLDPGLNHATISLGQLNPGMYYVFFVSEGVRRSFPFVISR